MQLLYPTKNHRQTQGFGRTKFARRSGWYRLGIHPGIDYGAVRAGVAGDPIFAANSGTVTVRNYGGSGYGLHVIIDHGGGWKTLYGHLKRAYVITGQRVSLGQQIGEMGTTGLSTAVHLHFGLLRFNAPVNPTKYLIMSPMEFDKRLTRLEEQLRKTQSGSFRDERFVLTDPLGELYFCNHKTKTKYKPRATELAKIIFAHMAGRRMHRDELKDYRAVKNLSDV